MNAAAFPAGRLPARRAAALRDGAMGITGMNRKGLGPGLAGEGRRIVPGRVKMSFLPAQTAMALPVGMDGNSSYH